MWNVEIYTTWQDVRTKEKNTTYYYFGYIPEGSLSFGAIMWRIEELKGAWQRKTQNFKILKEDEIRVIPDRKELVIRKRGIVERDGREYLLSITFTISHNIYYEWGYSEEFPAQYEEVKI